MEMSVLRSSVSRISALPALLVLVIVGVLFALLPTEQRALAQVLLVPVLFTVLWRVSIGGVRIPRWVFLIAAFGVVVGASIRFSYANLSRGAVLVATVSHQDLQQDKRIYRDRLRQFLGGAHDSLVGVCYERIENAHDAVAALNKSSKIGGVVWGSPRWMTLSLRPREPLSFADLPDTTAGHQLFAEKILPNLKIIRSIPEVSLAQGQRDASVFFISKLILLWNQFSTDSVRPEDSAEFDRKLQTLFRIPTQGSSRTHLAVPMWMMGTRHLINAVREPQAGQEDLTQAIVAFKYALSELRGERDPALQVAVRNNYGIALLVEFNRDKQRSKVIKAAGKQFVAAVRLGRTSGANGAVVADNYAELQKAAVLPLPVQRHR